jgi:transcriptional regulator with XRE-family HTH domain
MVTEELHTELTPAYTPPNAVALRRIEKGLSQEQVAGELGISRETYSRLENGIIWPNPYRLEKLARVLGFDFMSLISMLIEIWKDAHPLQEVA